MTTTVKSKEALIVPLSVRRRAGIKAGDRLQFKTSSRSITITALEPTYRTKAEVAAIRKGEAAIARGEFVTLDDLLDLDDMDHLPRKPRAKTTQKNPR